MTGCCRWGEEVPECQLWRLALSTVPCGHRTKFNCHQARPPHVAHTTTSKTHLKQTRHKLYKGDVVGHVSIHGLVQTLRESTHKQHCVRERPRDKSDRHYEQGSKQANLNHIPPHGWVPATSQQSAHVMALEHFKSCVELLGLEGQTTGT